MYNQFFYSGQIRRFITQFIRMVSNFQVEFITENGRVLQRVPVYYGDSSRQAAQIIRGNSENITKAVPAMAVYVENLVYDQTRTQEPYFVGKLNLRERKYDENTGQYTGEQGDTLTVERLMPVPYKLTVKLDIWTSSTEQKLQLVEQIAVLFNPALEIQNTDNYVDWSSLSYALLVGNNWSSRSVPVGTEDSIDVYTMSFELPIWLSPPAKVKHMGVIKKIINSIYDSPSGDLLNDMMDEGNLMARMFYTPLDYSVLYIGDRLILMKQNEVIDPDNDEQKLGTPDIWRSIIDTYGELKDGVTQIRLSVAATGTEIIGTVAYDPDDETALFFTPIADTLPVNTLAPVNAVINPIKVEVGSNLLNPVAGTRFLILDDIGSVENANGTVAWGNLIAGRNDIIEFDGVKWRVVFDSSQKNTVEYVTNMTSGVQFRWTGTKWVKSVEGKYEEGMWTIGI